MHAIVFFCITGSPRTITFLPHAGKYRGELFIRIESLTMENERYHRIILRYQGKPNAAISHRPHFVTVHIHVSK